MTTDRRPSRHAVPHTRAWGLGLAFVTAAISGVAIFVNAEVVGQVGDATVYTTAKNGVAAIVLLVALAAVSAGRAPEHRDPDRSAPTGRQWLGLAAVGAVGGSLPFVLFFEGLARAHSAAGAGFLHKTLVLWVALLAVPLLRERLTGWHVGAVGLLLLGQVVLLGGPGQLGMAGGELMVLAATWLWAVELVLAKRLLATIGSLAVGTARLGIGIGLLLGYVVLTGRGPALLAMTGQQWSWALLTGLLLAGYVASWYAALARAQAIDVTAVLVFGQVVTAGLATSISGAAIGPDLVGLGLLTAGVAGAVVGALRAGRRAEAVATA